MAALYAKDPKSYWVHYGLPNLARGASLVEQLKAYEIDPFSGIRPFFREAAFVNAAQTGNGLHPRAQVHAKALFRSPIVSLTEIFGTSAVLQPGRVVPSADLVCGLVQGPDMGCSVTHLHACNPEGIRFGNEGPFPDPRPQGCGYGPVTTSLDPWGHFTRTVRLLTSDLEMTADANAVNEIYDALGTVYATALDEGALAGFGPTMPDYPDEPVGQTVVCSPGNGEGTASEPDTNVFGNVGKAYTVAGNNGLCATLAAGYCGARLGLLPNKVDAEVWKKISDEIGAVPAGGASLGGIEAYYKRLNKSNDGICYGHFYNIPYRSMNTARDAKRALDEGCDVMIEYNDRRALGHVEVIVDIKPGPGGAGPEATLTTVSWGRKATVEYSPSGQTGKVNNKSDAAQYKRESFPPDGSADIYYFCPCEKFYKSQGR